MRLTLLCLTTLCVVTIVSGTVFNKKEAKEVDVDVRVEVCNDLLPALAQTCVSNSGCADTSNSSCCSNLFSYFAMGCPDDLYEIASSNFSQCAYRPRYISNFFYDKCYKTNVTNSSCLDCQFKNRGVVVGDSCYRGDGGNQSSSALSCSVCRNSSMNACIACPLGYEVQPVNSDCSGYCVPRNTRDNSTTAALTCADPCDQTCDNSTSPVTADLKCSVYRAYAKSYCFNGNSTCLSSSPSIYCCAYLYYYMNDSCTDDISRFDISPSCPNSPNSVSSYYNQVQCSSVIFWPGGYYTPTPTPTPTSTSNSTGFEGQLRLVGGNATNNGRLEIYHNGVWGTVCDDYFGQNSADVACRQLGYARATGFGSYGAPSGSGQIWLDNVNCTGNETSLSSCQHLPFGSHDCQHSEDVILTCTSSSSTPTPTPTPTSTQTYICDYARFYARYYCLVSGNANSSCLTSSPDYYCCAYIYYYGNNSCGDINSLFNISSSCAHRPSSLLSYFNQSRCVDIIVNGTNNNNNSTNTTTSAPTPSRSFSRTPSRSFSRTPSRSLSRTPSRSFSRTPSRSFSRTPSKSFSRTPSKSLSRTSSADPTSDPESESQTPSKSISRSATKSVSRSPSKSISRSATRTPTRTRSRTPTRTRSRTPTRTRSRTPSRTRSRTPTRTPSRTGPKP